MLLSKRFHLIRRLHVTYWNSADKIGGKQTDVQL